MSRTRARLMVRSVREIPRLCGCEWRMLYRRRRPAGWERPVPHPGCALHGTKAGTR